MATSKKIHCPICGLEDQKAQKSDRGERLSLECARCGKFTITNTAANTAKSRGLSPKLSAWVRSLKEYGSEAPTIDRKALEEIQAALPAYRVSEKQLLLMRALERKTDFPGRPVVATPRFDYPLAWAASEEEFKYLIRSLIERNLVRRIDGPADLKDSFTYDLEITADGWDFLDEHARPSVMSDQVFVAMSFSDDLKSAWEVGIRPALTKAGFKPHRVDAQPHIDKIDTKIIAEIKNSRFLVVDVTEQKQGVYFEAGYAIGLGLPVVWCVRSDDLEKVHFDTRQYNHIVWKNEQDLADQLHLFVTAIIGRGSAA